MATELGVSWDTVMEAVREHGEPLVDDPGRVGQGRALGVDETAWLSATKDHLTLLATGLVDLEAADRDRRRPRQQRPRAGLLA